MKFIKILIIVSFIIFIGGCTKDKSASEYTFTYNNLTITPGTLFSNVLANLGQPNDTSTENNLDSNSPIHIYQYDHFVIETYYEDNTEKVYSIAFIDSEVSTNEGIKIGDRIDNIINTYGSSFDNKNNIYVYNYLNTNMSFIVENDIIVSIKYYLA